MRYVRCAERAYHTPALPFCAENTREMQKCYCINDRFIVVSDVDGYRTSSRLWFSVAVSSTSTRMRAPRIVVFICLWSFYLFQPLANGHGGAQLRARFSSPIAVWYAVSRPQRWSYCLSQNRTALFETQADKGRGAHDATTNSIAVTHDEVHRRCSCKSNQRGAAFQVPDQGCCLCVAFEKLVQLFYCKVFPSEI